MSNTQGLPEADAKTKEQRRHAVIGSSVGTIIEWYDFTLYGLASALVFAPLFFPGAGNLAGMLGAFAAFAVGFGARPIGGLIFAHYGDRVGRKMTLLVTLMMMGVATTFIGLLPTAESIGVWAPILLIVLRIFQGAGAGAEFAGAMTMASESSDPQRRAYTAGFPGASVYIGMALATTTFALLTLLPDEQFLSWGWRVPFIASAVIVAFALYFRLRVTETAAFEEAEKDGAVMNSPLAGAIKNHWRVLICGMALFTFTLPWVYIVQTFSVSYVTGTLTVNPTAALVALIVAELLTIPATLYFGKLADRIGRKPVLLGAAVFGIVLSFPLFWLYGTENILLVGVGLVLGLAIIQGATIGVSAALLAEIFPTNARWSGIAISREIPAAAVGGTAPLVATALVATSGGSPWLVGAYLMGLSIIGLIGIAFLPETLPSKVDADTLDPIMVADVEPVS
ncbi:MFS transporter [Rhodococcus fascians]|uniref:MFS transporter n=1 Tax=Rhodococcus sp. 14-2483-1-2 TaxID=2023147 RepID=UPI000B9B49B5|nr:MFS transporter [Rhodococcus sp. 14-2483-1-2]MBY4130940.1 MFS transporter [Rhodococcus fascians]MBY4229027.1 MFS transporter [Rhodococcus fascians]OZF29456.1 MFS transporter [Rhodococcus sp. 14-2483-1-2]